MAPAKAKPNELYLERLFDAPVEAVWEAWVDPKQVAQWWGPRGFTLTSKEKEVRPGGTWTYTMHGPDGTDFPNCTLFHEVEKHKKLVYDHGASADRPPLFRVTVRFHDLKGKQTRMEMWMALATEEAARETRKFIRKAGGESTWDRLAEYLGERQSGRDLFFINRTFEAPVETMFEMFTNPPHFEKWLPPTGLKMEHLRAEIRPKGSSFYKMTDGEELTMYGKLYYREITPPNRIVYSQVFTDADENISRHPFSPTWPEAMLTTVTLTEEEAGRTRVTIQWEIYGDATAEERATFRREKAGMTQGWTGSFDKLEAYLGERKG
jgi:uncharacterized protein YndB with AHSA1/START domain